MRYQSIVSGLFRVTDAVVVVGAWLVSYWARFFLPPFEVTRGLPPFRTYASLVPLVAVLWVAVFTLFDVYSSGRMRSRRQDAELVLRAHGIALLLFMAVAYLYDAYKYSRLVIVYFGVISAFGVIVLRVAVRTALRAVRRHGRDLHRVLVVGGGRSAQTLVQHLERFPELGMEVIGLLGEHAAGAPSWGKPILGPLADFGAIVKAQRPDEVIIALPPEQHHELNRLLGELGDEPIGIRVIPDVHQHVTVGCRVEDFEGLPVIHLNATPMTAFQELAKRVLDVILSALALVVLAPLMVVIALLVKLTSRGPVLYAQERMGLNGKTFHMLKFRSMRVDAEATSGATWCRKSDDRRTPIGALLRRSSLDELPQLWNVLVGDMSLVGPRPERPVFVNQFREQIPNYMLRHKVKAGITGWAQVNGWRGDTSVPERVACDLYYIQNWSLDLDLKILTMTLWKGFINKNAY
jgi:Undecaprenyl-phosphate glucose phosphotransferase